MNNLLASQNLQFYRTTLDKIKWRYTSPHIVLHTSKPNICITLGPCTFRVTKKKGNTVRKTHIQHFTTVKESYFWDSIKSLKKKESLSPKETTFVPKSLVPILNLGTITFGQGKIFWNFQRFLWASIDNVQIQPMHISIWQFFYIE